MTILLQTMAGASFRDDSTVRDRLAELYQRHREEVYRFLVGQGLPPHTAQDITQEVFLKLFHALQKGADVSSSGQAWLYRVAARLAVSHWRRTRRVTWVELDADASMAESLRSGENLPDSKIAEAEKLRRVSEEMRRLPKEQRLCLHLRAQGLRYHELAKILGVGLSTAAEWLALAVERLQRVAHE